MATPTLAKAITGMSSTNNLQSTAVLKKALAALAIFAVLGVPLPQAFAAVQADQSTAVTDAYTGSYIASFKESTSLEQGHALIEQFGGVVVYDLPFSHALVFTLQSAVTRGILAQNASIVSISPEIIYTLAAPHLLAVATAETSPASQNKSVNIFILDTGAAKRGVTYASTGSAVSTVSPIDRDSHGTIVALSAKEVIDERNINAQLHSINIVNSKDYITNATVAEGVRQAIKGGADVINLSAEYGHLDGPIDSTIAAAFDEAQAAGIPIVVADGNDSGKRKNALTTHPDVISVGGLGNHGDPLYDSNGQNPETRADVFAKGTIRSPITGDTESGTSFAAPRVAALIAEIKQKPIDSLSDVNGNGKWDTEEIKARLKSGIFSGEYAFLRDGDILAGTTPGGQLAQGAPSGSVSDFRTLKTLGSAPDSVVPTCKGFGSSFEGVCQACDFAELLKNVIDRALSYSTIVVLFMFSYAGILYVTAAANPKQTQTARSVFTKVFIGFIILLTAWLTVNIILNVLTGRSLDDWSNIDCGTIIVPAAPGSGQ